MLRKYLPLALLCLLTSACASNEELENRLDRRNEHYSNLQDRRELRQDARDKRSDDWYDRVMH